MSTPTESLTLAKALSVKNRLAGRLADARRNVAAYNSVLEGQAGGDQIDVRAEFERYGRLQEALIRLKALIQAANAPIAEDVYRLGEYKDRLKLLDELPTKSGPEPSPYGNAVYNYVCVFAKPDTLRMARRLEVEIDAVQDKLNAFNASTRIDVPVEILGLAR